MVRDLRLPSGHSFLDRVDPSAVGESVRGVFSRPAGTRREPNRQPCGRPGGVETSRSRKGPLAKSPFFYFFPTLFVEEMGPHAIRDPPTRTRLRPWRFPPPDRPNRRARDLPSPQRGTLAKAPGFLPETRMRGGGPL